MRRIFVFLLTMAVLLSFPGCAAREDGAEEGFCLTCQGVPITPGAEAAPILEALGAPKGYTESASCAFEGLDKTYDYGSFCLTTCTVEGKDYICTLWLVDTLISTPEGLHIGTTWAEAEQILGSDAFQGSSCRQTRGNTRRVLLLGEDGVYSIRYELILS